MTVSFAERLRLERYRLITDRQKYFTGLAVSTYASYAKAFTSLVAGGVALVYLRKQLDVQAGVIASLLHVIAVLVTLLAAVAVGQIVFCLVRWYGLRSTECEINPECPPAECWAWIFEGLYILAIVVSGVATWLGVLHFDNVLLRSR